MPPDTELLLTHASFLRSLSRALVADEALADDLVQETWAAALARPPARPHEARPWLARVLRNAAATFFRGERRRRHRERAVARREDVPSAARLVERESIARRVTDAVFSLQEPYRTTILLRFYDDMKPAAIARCQDVPVETVRTRLRRGLEQVRAHLDASAPGGRDRSHWITGVALLGEPSGSAASVASTGVASTSTATAATSTGSASLSQLFTLAPAGGVLMSTKLTAISLTATVLLGASSSFFWLQWREREEAYAVLARERDDLVVDLADENEKLAALEESLAATRSREQSLRRQLQEKNAELLTASARADENAESGATREEATSDAALPSAARGDRYFISSVEEADAVASDLLSRGDIEGLWLLAADLLQLGEPGYDKLIEVARLLDSDGTKEQINALWSHEEFLAGRFFHDLTVHSGDLLRFALHLEKQPLPETPGILRELREELDDELGPILLGMYDGRDPKLLDAYVARYRRLLLQGGGASKISPGRVATCLAHIETENAREALLELAPGAPPEAQGDVARALAWTRDPRAVPVLRQMRASTTDARAARTIDAAIRMIE